MSDCEHRETANVRLGGLAVGTCCTRCHAFITEAPVTPDTRRYTVKWWYAVQLGMEIMHDVELVLAGQIANFTFQWGGRRFNVTAGPAAIASTPAVPPAPPTA